MVLGSKGCHRVPWGNQERALTPSCSAGVFCSLSRSLRLSSGCSGPRISLGSFSLCVSLKMFTQSLFHAVGGHWQPLRRIKHVYEFTSNCWNSGGAATQATAAGTAGAAGIDD